MSGYLCYGVTVGLRTWHVRLTQRIAYQLLSIYSEHMIIGSHPQKSLPVFSDSKDLFPQ